MWWILWLSLAVVFALFEAISPQLTTIWFAIASLISLAVSFIFPDNLLVQIIVFVVVSVILVLITRPLAKRFLTGKKNRVNADRCLGEEGIVISEINNVKGEGQINTKGVIWTARSEDGEIIAIGEHVTILRIEGVKVIVRRNSL